MNGLNKRTLRARLRWTWLVVFGWSGAIASAGCSTAPPARAHQVPETVSQQCPSDKWSADRLWSAVTLHRYRPRRLYDLDRRQRPIRLRSRRCSDCLAVVSYPEPKRFAGGPSGFSRMKDRSFVYDNALSALVATALGRQADARALLNTLVVLQRSDGAWGFSFHIKGDGFYNQGYVRAGVVAWALYAMARYNQVFRDGRYRRSMRRAGAWLASHQDPNSGLIRGGQGRWGHQNRFEPNYLAQWVSTEHNVDAYFALRLAKRVDPDGGWLSAGLLANAIHDSLWISEQGRFARGMSPKGLDRVTSLDAAGSWSALFAFATGRVERAKQALTWIDQKLRFTTSTGPRWRPSDQVKRAVWFVEASVALALAHRRLGQPSQSTAVSRSLSSWACQAGLPLSYSDSWQRDYPKSPAVAPMAWWVFWLVEERSARPWLWRRQL